MAEFKIKDYTEYLDSLLQASDSLLKDFPYTDSIAYDQQFTDTPAQKTAFTADGSDINVYTYDFTDPTGLKFFYGGGGGGNRIPLGDFLPVGIAGAGTAGLFWKHGVGDIGVLVYGDGEGLGSRRALFADSEDENFYFGLFFSDSSLEYFIDSNVNIGTSGEMAVKGATTAPAGGVKAIRIGDDTDFGIYFGSGAPTVSAAQGSLYLRTDGSSTSTRAYINTDGSTTWTALTTAA